MIYELKNEQFSGPIEKLLELIEEKKLEITEISLGEVTEDFLGYMKRVANSEAGSQPSPSGLRLLADFIAVASRLILLKSKSLLPGTALSDDEEGEIKDLELRLKLYSEIKPAVKALAGTWKNAKPEFGRPYFLAHQFSPLLASSSQTSTEAGVFYPGRKLTLETLVRSLEGLLNSFREINLETKIIKEKVVTLEEKIREIVERLGSFPESSLSNLSLSKTRSEIIVIFLAILHLAREQLINLEQEANFSDIMIKKNG